MYKIFLLSITALIFSGCMNGQSKPEVNYNLSAAEFSDKINELPGAPILDVRTPEEFGKGHLISALNFNWNGKFFDQQIANLDKSKPVFVYCLSGGRSSSAAKKMRSAGFNQVYELDGGIMKWRGANLPEASENRTMSKGMSRQQYDDLLNSNKLVLIDFYADWCAPCKKMKPYLEEISKDMSATVEVIRINADDNQALCKELNIDALPVLQLFKGKNLIWNHTGFIEKSEVIKQLN
jgi:thioredoxin 1